MKKYLILIISLFLVNANTVNANIKINNTAPDSVKMTTRSSSYITKADTGFISNGQSLKTYFKRGEVYSEDGVYFYCLDKGLTAPENNKTLIKDNILGEKFSCFIKEAEYNSNWAAKGNFALNQAFVWALRGTPVSSGTFTATGQRIINTRYDDCKNFTITNPSISISRENKYTKEGWNYYNVKVTLSYTDNYYGVFDGTVNVVLNGAPTGTIITTSETGTSNVNKINTGISTIFIRVPSSALTDDLSFELNVSADITKYRAYSYCRDENKNGSCDSGFQRIVPRRLFKTTGSVSRGKQINMNAIENEECTISVVPNINYSGTAPADTLNVNGISNRSGKLDVLLTLDWTKKCGESITTATSPTNQDIGDINENSIFSVGLESAIEDQDYIWAGGPVKLSTSLENTIEITLDSDINNLETIPNAIKCSTNQTCFKEYVNVEEIVKDKLKEDYDDFMLRFINDLKDNFSVFVSDPDDNKKEINDIVNKSITNSYFGNWTTDTTKTDLKNKVEIKLKDSYLNLQTAEDCYGTDADCKSDNYNYEIFRGDETRYYTPLKFPENTKFKFYVLNNDENNFDRWIYFDSEASGLADIPIKRRFICDSEDLNCSPNGGFNFYYRQIDLSNPFPNGLGTTNWSRMFIDNDKIVGNTRTYGDIEYTVSLKDVETDGEYSLANINADGTTKKSYISHNKNGVKHFKLGELAINSNSLNIFGKEGIRGDAR